MLKNFYSGIDVGSSVCEMSVVNEVGMEVFHRKFATSERNVISAITEARKQCRGKFHLTIEEGDMAQWLAGIIRPLVDRFVVCDPKRNSWIARDPSKDDCVDSQKLANLMRGGFLKEVYHSRDEDRVEFKRVVQHYHDVTRTQASLKCQIKARFRANGVIVKGKRLFEAGTTEAVIAQLPTTSSRQVVRQLYEMLDAAVDAQGRARKLMVEVGRKYPEVALLKEMYGLGPVWASTFVGYVQTPFRFRNKRKLWKFSGLGVTERSSNGEPLGYKRLDRDGVRMLKHLSYRVFLTSMTGDTDMRRFYRASLERTKDKTHARLNTQRKILAVLLAMWKTGESYRSEGGIKKGKRPVSRT